MPHSFSLSRASSILPSLRSATRRKSQELLPKYTEHDTKRGASSQFAERARGVLKALPQQQRTSWAGCTCAGAQVSTSLLFSQRIEVQYRFSAGGFSASYLYFPFSSPCACFYQIYVHAVRLVAVLSRPHVAVQPTKIPTSADKLNGSALGC